MQEVGIWAIYQLAGSEMTTTYFKNRQEADRFQATEGFTLRRVNLEDASMFIMAFYSVNKEKD